MQYVEGLLSVSRSRESEASSTDLSHAVCVLRACLRTPVDGGGDERAHRGRSGDTRWLSVEGGAVHAAGDVAGSGRVNGSGDAVPHTASPRAVWRARTERQRPFPVNGAPQFTQRGGRGWRRAAGPEVARGAGRTVSAGVTLRAAGKPASVPRRGRWVHLALHPAAAGRGEGASAGARAVAHDKGGLPASVRPRAARSAPPASNEPCRNWVWLRSAPKSWRRPADRECQLNHISTAAAPGKQAFPARARSHRNRRPLHAPLTLCAALGTTCGGNVSCASA